MGILWAHMGAIGCIVLTKFTYLRLACTYVYSHTMYNQNCMYCLEGNIVINHVTCSNTYVISVQVSTLVNQTHPQTNKHKDRKTYHAGMLTLRVNTGGFTGHVYLNCSLLYNHNALQSHEFAHKHDTLQSHDFVLVTWLCIGHMDTIHCSHMTLHYNHMNTIHCSNMTALVTWTQHATVTGLASHTSTIHSGFTWLCISHMTTIHCSHMTLH